MLKIKAFEKDDFERLINWIPNQRFLVQWAGPFFYYPLNKRQLRQYLSRSEGKYPERYIFKAVEDRNQKVIGHIEIGYINYLQKEGSLCRVLIGDRNYQKKGFGLRMLELATEYAFKTIYLNRLRLGVYDFNENAIRCYQKIGFQIYRVQKRLPVPGNEFWNLVCMELDRETWKERNPSLSIAKRI